MAFKRPLTRRQRPKTRPDVSDTVHDTDARPEASQSLAPSVEDMLASPDLVRQAATVALLGVLTMPNAPAAAIAQSARTLLELSGALGPGKVPAGQTKPVSEMTLEEIEAEIAASAAD